MPQMIVPAIFISLVVFGVVKIIVDACSGRNMLIPGSSGRGPSGEPARVVGSRGVRIALIAIGIAVISPLLVALLLPR